MTPMAAQGEEAVGSMGTDTPISALSDKSKLLFTYFKQNFAQVTNPPIDPIREEIVMSLVSIIGPRPNLFDLEGSSRTKRLEVRQPILTNEDLEKIRAITEVADNHFKSITLDMTWPAVDGAAGMEKAIDALSAQAEQAVRDGINIIILSDRKAGTDRVPMPSLLGCAAVHHHLIRQGLRTSVGLVVESAEPREVHHFGCLAGYGAEAINPYLAFETLIAMHAELPRQARQEGDRQALHQGDRQGPAQGDVQDGHLDLSVLLRRADLRRGRTEERLRRQVLHRHRDPDRGRRARTRSPRRRCAAIATPSATRRSSAACSTSAANTPCACAARTMSGTPPRSRPCSTRCAAIRRTSTARSRRSSTSRTTLVTIRGLFRVKTAEEDERKPVPLDEVEPAKDIVKRFATGAMSFGSISREAHTTLAIAMNRIGGKSNTGEGGEEADRFKPLPNGDSMRSAIKQVASGRFGVTAEYLVNSDMMQIKMAQGAKPGEGGQLPGHKVDETIAKVRHSTPGVGLISPPPHHDIYSIEDLAQLIFDLKNVNPAGDVSVKLVSEVGVGTVAAGVSKARADHVTISGFEGGTGASPLTSLKHAGSPWEIGLAETHQTLVANRLRSRIAVQVDGGIRTGRDVVIGALLGADEFGFSTAPLIAAGCIMMRKCHLNTCPVGVATQDPVLRKRFTGQPEHVINYFFFVAEEVRELMAAMGYPHLQRDDRPDADARPARGDRALEGARASTSRRLFTKPDAPDSVAHLPLRGAGPQDRRHPRPQADRGGAGRRSTAARRCGSTPPIRNIDRTAGAMLSGEIAKRYGHAGLPDDTIHVELNGHRRAELRRVPRPRRHARARRRRQRLCRQGPVGRPHRRPAAGRRRHRAGGVDHRRQHRALRRDRRRMLFPRRRRRALRRAQLRRHRRRRRRRRSRLRIHDRRRRRRARHDRPQLRRRHVGRHRLRARRGRHASPSAATWRWSSSSRSRPRRTISATHLRPRRRPRSARPRRRHRRHDALRRRAAAHPDRRATPASPARSAPREILDDWDELPARSSAR